MQSSVEQADYESPRKEEEPEVQEVKQPDPSLERASSNLSKSANEQQSEARSRHSRKSVAFSAKEKRTINSGTNDEGQTPLPKEEIVVVTSLYKLEPPELTGDEKLMHKSQQSTEARLKNV